MKTFRDLLLAGVMLLTIGFTAASCSDDDNNEPQNHSIIGTWQLKNADVDVILKTDATMTEQQMEAFLVDYTFFAPNSQITFTTDTVTLTAELDGVTQPPFKLPYTLKNGILTIMSPIPSMTIEGSVDIDTHSMEFDLTPASYMSILQFIGYAFPELQPTFNQIQSAEVDYDLIR